MNKVCIIYTTNTKIPSDPVIRHYIVILTWSALDGVLRTWLDRRMRHGGAGQGARPSGRRRTTCPRADLEQRQRECPPVPASRWRTAPWRTPCPLYWSARSARRQTGWRTRRRTGQWSDASMASTFGIWVRPVSRCRRCGPPRWRASCTSSRWRSAKWRRKCAWTVRTARPRPAGARHPRSHAASRPASGAARAGCACRWRTSPAWTMSRWCTSASQPLPRSWWPARSAMWTPTSWWTPRMRISSTGTLRPRCVQLRISLINHDQ